MKVPQKHILQLVAVLAVFFLAFNFVFPSIVNKAISFTKEKLGAVFLFKNLPLFPEKDFRLGLDLKGGVRLLYQADISKIESSERDSALQGLRDVIERRVNLFGVAEPVVALQQSTDSYRVSVEMPGVYDVEKAVEMIGKTPYLDFREQNFTGEWDPVALTPDKAFKATSLTGQYLKRASLEFNNTTYKPQVALEFNAQGSKLFEEITKKNVGKRLAIFVDDILISAPNVEEAISGGKAQISGNFTEKEAKDLVSNLNAGALPVPIQLISQQAIGPSLGASSLEKSLMAGIFGLVLVCLFMLIFYRFSGVLAVLALLVYGVAMLFLFKFIPITLTLAGIAGAILSVGMAVDANILIFERQKEERKIQENFGRALEIGFDRAWSAIRDSNVTTLLVALIMFIFGTSFVKGFAVTLSLGILISMFSALFVTRTFMRMFVNTKLAKINWLWS